MDIYKGSRAQSISKTITWRIIAAIITGVVVFLHTGEIKKTTQVVITIEIILTAAYYIHERIWVRISKETRR